MSNAFKDHLEDIALFFEAEGKQKRCWVTKSLYTARKIEAVDPSWKRAVVTEGGSASSPYYVANLSKLGPPGESVKPADTNQQASKTATADIHPQSGDLVVIPFKSESAYLIKQSEYRDPDVCKPIASVEGADLAFLAVTQGVVLANIPKEDITGMSCYLLNLSKLK